MPLQSKRQLATLDALTTTPPPAPLPPSHALSRIVKAQGNNLYLVELPEPSSSPPLLVELASIFRGKAWLRRGGYVLVHVGACERENRIEGVIVNVVRDERAWRKMAYWPKEFSKREQVEDSDEEDSVVGKMPPNSDDEE
ncbi:hypothetical protein RUND412_004268 [Rhizina undulata]